jgi:dTDP-4-dehydrorhamnose 3,5-epimerase-like enzyme
MKINCFGDKRGILFVSEDLPFVIKRIFWVTNIIEKRGNHAHKNEMQIIIALNGNIIIEYENKEMGKNKIVLQENEAMLIPPMTWLTYYASSSKTICLVLSNQTYKESLKGLINNYEEFRRAIQ